MRSVFSWDEPDGLLVCRRNPAGVFMKEDQMRLWRHQVQVLPVSSSVMEQSSVAPDGFWILASISPLAPFSWTAKEASCPTFRAIS